ncbi:MAG TPA: oligosaccharide flippase family protein [Candidatus Woesebacteria bacterium]|nr:oligosaccharide flippase family protein [Candidatus Woesebacteria bacterium]
MFKRLAVNTGVQILGKAIMVLVSLITTGILTRRLGIEVYGQYIFITSILVFFDSLADFGTSIMGVREASRKEGEEQVKVWTNTLISRLIMAGLSLALGIIFIFSWNDFREIRIEAILAWVMILFTSLAGSLGVVWQTRIRMEIKVLIEVMFPTIFLLCLWIYGGNISLRWIFGTYLFARIITLAWGWWLGRGTIKFKLVDKKLISKILKISWPMGVYLLIFSAYDRAVDSLMIQRYLGAREVAWYGLAYKIYGVLIQPAYFLVNGIFPILSKKQIQSTSNNIFKTSAIILFLSSVLVIIGVWLMAPMMVSILAGSEFGASVGVLRILIVALLFAYMGHLVGFTLISKEGQKEMLGVGLIILIFNLIGNLVVIPRHGIMGAAMVTVLTEMLSLGLMTLRLKRRW